MSKAGLDNRHRNKDGEISGKHGNIPSARCAKFPDRILPPVNEISLSQLRRDHKTHHLKHNIAHVSE